MFINPFLFLACVPKYEEVCTWTDWLDDEVDGAKVTDIPYEYELISDLRKLYSFCELPTDIICVVKTRRNESSEWAGQRSSCTKSDGFRCIHSDQSFPPFCFDYEIRLKCCEIVHVGCETTTAAPTTLPTTTAQPIISTTQVSTTPGRCP